MAPSALTDLDLAVDFFERGAAMSSCARQALPILRNLKDRALKAYSRYSNRHMSPSLDIQLHIGGPDDQFQDELAIFGGQTRVLTNKTLSRKRTRIPAKPHDSNATTPTASTPASVAGGVAAASTPSSDECTPLPQTVEEQMSHVHPSLMEYPSLFPSEASISFVNQSQQHIPMDIFNDSPFVPPHSQVPAGCTVASPSTISSASSSALFALPDTLPGVHAGSAHTSQHCLPRPLAPRPRKTTRTRTRTSSVYYK